jgi:hypothetical protein
MQSLPPGIQVFMAVEPVDCRKSFEGFSAAVETAFQRNQCLASDSIGRAAGRLPSFHPALTIASAAHRYQLRAR